MQPTPQPMLVAQPLDYETIDAPAFALPRCVRRGLLLYSIGALIGGTGLMSYALVEWMAAAGWVPVSGFGSINGLYYLLARGAVTVGLYGGAAVLLVRRNKAATALLRIAVVLSVVENALSIASYFWMRPSVLPTGLMVQSTLSVASTLFIALAIWTLSNPNLLFADRR